MAERVTRVFVCDRCGETQVPRDHRRAEDDDEFPDDWARVHFRDHSVDWGEKDLCRVCASKRVPF